jgi:RimJ/RimL family protein N-acetyltransferase
VQVNFFRCDREAAANLLPLLPSDVRVSCWRPDLDGFPPRGSRSVENQFWWALAKSGGFVRPGFCEMRVEQDGRLLHRLVVTPRWHRFPFMAAQDLQIGAVWTAPEARRRRIAQAAIAETHRRFGTDNMRFWYVADAANDASEALARSCGYRLVASGRRTRRFGTRLFGQYVIDRFL